MDINTLRIAATVVSFLVFIGILAWAFSRRNRERFEADAQIPFSHEQ
ncbi:cytochrome oxidase [Ramlibacter tataouinensis]|uniref:Cytochrome oxidase n=1 Tax=Ramlibacter tataouinensis TaxID=94132 RepID=A0A140HL77_9BURK|nr:cytochrome oxidase [Ramlibacter tataouinensis]